jgi:CheY-like chemotaxis protein
MLGWSVLSHLKRDRNTRHIPVQIVTLAEERQHGLERGAFGYLNKPLTTESIQISFDKLKAFTRPRRRSLLIVEDDARERESQVALLADDDIEVASVATGTEALELLRARQFDCVVLDLRLPDISGVELLSQIQQDPALREVPIVVSTGKELTADEEADIRKMAKSIVLKGVQSPERLLDETALFLHRVVANLPEHKQRMLERLHHTDEALVGKQVLVVDDDARNIFALSSLLERRGMNVISASNGEEAIALIQDNPTLSLVLMDIMMPEMDGYETMRRIRGQPEFRMLPIIALTAKAMKGDREKCLEAGASDYIAKPVNMDQLLSLLRIWLHR